MTCLVEVIVFVGIGLAFQALSRIAPFRRVEASPAMAWDALAVVAYFSFMGVVLVLEARSHAACEGVVWIAELRRAAAQWPLWWLIPVNFLVSDFLVYWIHRALHGRWLWPGHAFHHSSSYLYWASGLRASFVHVALSWCPYSITLLFLPLPRAGMAATALLLFAAANQHYLHSNVRVPWTRQLEWLLVTPRFHFVHHSKRVSLTNSNYGIMFSLWDRLFGTYTNPDAVPEDDALGLDYANSNLRLLAGLPPPATRGQPCGRHYRSPSLPG